MSKFAQYNVVLKDLVNESRLYEFELTVRRFKKAK
jgi:hypothetical protein